MELDEQKDGKIVNLFDALTKMIEYSLAKEGNEENREKLLFVLEKIRESEYLDNPQSERSGPPSYPMTEE